MYHLLNALWGKYVSLHTNSNWLTYSTFFKLLWHTTMAENIISHLKMPDHLSPGPRPQWLPCIPECCASLPGTCPCWCSIWWDRRVMPGWCGCHPHSGHSLCCCSSCRAYKICNVFFSNDTMWQWMRFEWFTHNIVVWCPKETGRHVSS